MKWFNLRFKISLTSSCRFSSADLSSIIIFDFQLVPIFVCFPFSVSGLVPTSIGLWTERGRSFDRTDTHCDSILLWLESEPFRLWWIRFKIRLCVLLFFSFLVRSRWGVIAFVNFGWIPFTTILVSSLTFSFSWSAFYKIT